MKPTKDYTFCDQKFYVQDREGYPVNKALVSVEGGIYKAYTNSTGYCEIDDLIEGKDHTAVASKTGYISSDPYWFIACKGDIVLTLSKPKCTQRFLVQDSEGYPIREAEIALSTELEGTFYKKTDHAGSCDFNCTEGKEYTATARKTGYSGEPQRTFTACRSQIVFTLQRTHAVLTFRAQTPERVAQPNAKVTVQPGNHECTTDSYGECTIALQPPYIGEAIASHANYRDAYPEDLDIDTITEYGPFFLRLMPPICSQLFIVAAEDGTLLQNAEVLMRDGETEEYIDRKITDSKGECRIYFTARYYKAKATCEGYKSQQHPKSECNPGSTVFFYLPPDTTSAEVGMAQSIVKQNARAMTEATALRYSALTLPGRSDPPHICPMCGISFNIAGDFIAHIEDHLIAYKNQEKKWL